MKKKHWILLTSSWTIFIIVSFIWNYTVLISNNNKLVHNRAKAIFQQIVDTRSWNATHGGIYVLVTAKTQPNPYLEDSLRDLVTVNGLQLTKMNPAFMTRQISEISITNASVRFHITSLNPIRPGNEPDEWEKRTLKKFEIGTSEIIEQTKKEPVLKYRYMAPLYTEKSCLQCHAKQGYKVGQVRGGISISFPATIYLDGIKKQTNSLALVHIILLLGGIAGLLSYYEMSKKYLTKIKEKNNELKQINATKDKFFSIIAHDLKSPFNSIMGFSELLVEQINEKNYDEIKENAGIIFHSSRLAMDLLTNLMEWSRSQSNRIEFNPMRIDLAAITNEIIFLFDDIAGQKEIVIKSELPSNTPVFADKAMIKTVMRNLISNAIKFSKTGGKIIISVTEGKSKLTVSVKDNGIGIPNSRIDKLFRIDENYSTQGTANETGTGLGLILCKEFIEKHDEKIWVESKEGSGSTFYFTLPLNS